MPRIDRGLSPLGRLERPLLARSGRLLSLGLENRHRFARYNNTLEMVWRRQRKTQMRFTIDVCNALILLGLKTR